MNGCPGEELSRRLIVKVGEVSRILNLAENQHLDEIPNLSKERQRFGVCTTAHYSTSCVSVHDPPSAEVDGHLKNGT
jgi:hypothetical protein